MTDEEIQASEEEMEQFNISQNEKCVSGKNEKLNDLMNKISLSLKDGTLQQGFEIICKRISELEKENEELKEKLNIRSCQNCKRNNKSCPNDGSCDHYSKWEDYKNPQLTKDHPTDRTPGLHTEQRLEPNMDGLCNTITTVQKDNLVMESERIIINDRGFKDKSP